MTGYGTFTSPGYASLQQTASYSSCFFGKQYNYFKEFILLRGRDHGQRRFQTLPRTFSPLHWSKTDRYNPASLRAAGLYLFF